MKFRKLRIAWSFLWGTACVLLIAMWVRSYWWLDSTHVVPNHRITSFRGSLQWDTAFEIAPRPYWPYLLDWFDNYSLPNDEIIVTRGRGGISIYFWIPTLIFATIAAAPWLRFRFSLRTLLLATTLVAVALGLIVYAA